MKTAAVVTIVVVILHFSQLFWIEPLGATLGVGSFHLSLWVSCGFILVVGAYLVWQMFLPLPARVFRSSRDLCYLVILASALPPVVVPAIALLKIPELVDLKTHDTTAVTALLVILSFIYLPRFDQQYRREYDKYKRSGGSAV